MKRYELHVEGYHTALTAEEIAELFQARRLRRTDHCREVGSEHWRTLDELFPLLKYDSTSSAPASPMLARVVSSLEGSDRIGDIVQPMTSALKAGWICFGLGLLVSWFFPLGNAFFSIAIITAVVAMCTHQVNRGLALLLTSFAGIAVSALLFFTLVFTAVAVVASPAIEKANADLDRLKASQDRALRQLDASNRQMQSAMQNAAAQFSAPRPVSTPPGYDPVADRQRQYEIAMQQKPAAERAAAKRPQR